MDQYISILKRGYQIFSYRILVGFILFFVLSWQYYNAIPFCFGCSSVQLVLFLSLFCKKKRWIQLALLSSLLVVTVMVYQHYFYESNLCLISWDHDVPKCSSVPAVMFGAPFIVWAWIGLIVLLASTIRLRESEKSS